MAAVFSAVLAIAVLLSLVNIAYARLNNRTGDLVVTQTDSEDNVMARLQLANNSNATSTLLVDLSGTSVYKHTPNAGSVDISQIRLTWFTTGTATTSTEVLLGVIASTTKSGSLTDIHWFARETFFADNDNGIDTTQVDERSQERVLSFSPSLLKTRITSAEPANFVTNDTSLATSLFATTSPLITADGTYSAPGVGDVVMRIHSQTGNATTSATVLYRVTE